MDQAAAWVEAGRQIETVISKVYQFAKGPDKYTLLSPCALIGRELPARAELGRRYGFVRCSLCICNGDEFS